jgi:Putative transposase DNA-binding domain
VRWTSNHLPDAHVSVTIKVYKFGLLDPVSGWDQTAIDVLFLRNKLWNNLVVLEHEKRQDYRNLLLDSDTELAIVQARLDAIEVEKVSLTTRKNAMRAKARSRQVDTAEIDQEIKKLLEERKSLGEQAKGLRERVKIKVKPLVAELDKQRYEKTKLLTKESGLWWCNSETVMAAYDVGRVKAMKEQTELRFHSFDGTGKYAVRRTGGFSLDDVMTGRLSFVRIQALPVANFDGLSERSQRSRARHHLTMIVLPAITEDGTKIRHKVTWPIILHRPLPDDCLIKNIHVQRKRVGDRFEWTCLITVDTPEVLKTMLDHPSISVCGIDLGFRQVKNDLRVATLADSSGGLRYYAISKDWLDSMNYVEAIQSDLSETANSVWAQLRLILTELLEYPEPLRDLITGMLKAGAKTPIRAIRAMQRTLSNEPSLIPDALALLDDWEKRTRRRAKEMHNLRDKLINRRKDIYRNIACEIARSYSLVRIANLRLKDMAKVKRNDGSDTKLTNIARKNRNRAALSELTLYIQQACTKNGVAVEKFDTTYMTRTCCQCGHLNPADTDNLFLSCEGCWAIYDQDVNAAINYLNGTKPHILIENI